MKKLLILILCLPLILFSQEKKQPNLFEVINMKVKAGQEDAFEAIVKAHNTEFHEEDKNYRAHLNYNINGPDGGKYVWIMGPTSWTALDDRPGEGAHDEDWKAVDAYVESYDNPTYWTLAADISHFVAGADFTKRLIWMYDIKKGQEKRWDELVGGVKKVYDEKRPNEPFWVIRNEFNNIEGMDVAIIFGFNKWAWFDRESTFAKDYEEVHGEGSLKKFLDEFEETINGKVEWIRESID